ncbi:MAG: biotin--[acetyl-CoA-carboxylase] ligase [Bacteroides sp.]|nr:biotin--[acetyl-CoA-carboxylase] ligase [Bacteroides sp.]
MTTKEKLLEIFEESGGKELSGQELANRLGISRTAVWKAIGSLREENYIIEAGKGKGYRLTEKGDLLSADRVRSQLPEELRGNEIIVLKTVDSTNNYAKKAAADGAKSGTVIIAEEQTAGRGRRGNSFYSPLGTGIYMTVILRPEHFTADTDLVTICAGCAVCMAVEALTDRKPLIKWVNDLYLDEKKICGILSEATADYEARTIDSIVVGMGINITTESFPDGLKQKAGKIGIRIGRAVLAAKVTECLFKCLSRTREDNIADYKAHSLVLGKKVSFTKGDTEYKGKAVDIDMKGQLIVETAETLMTLNSGEISVKL